MSPVWTRKKKCPTLQPYCKIGFFHLSINARWRIVKLPDNFWVCARLISSVIVTCHQQDKKDCRGFPSAKIFLIYILFDIGSRSSEDSLKILSASARLSTVLSPVWINKLGIFLMEKGLSVFFFFNRHRTSEICQISFFFPLILVFWSQLEVYVVSSLGISRPPTPP